MSDIETTVWWHVYPLGFCGAPIRENQGDCAPRLRRLIDWLDYAVDLGFGGLILGPVFTAQTHGYDSLNQFEIDPRLGTANDFRDLVAACKSRGLKIVLDGVFSHVGNQHPWLINDLANCSGELFDVDWQAAGGPRPRVWEGHTLLARLNHNSQAAVNYVCDVMAYWLAQGIDGWRLDAAYSVPNNFWNRVLPKVRETYPSAWFLGEVIHGNYPQLVTESQINTVTQYELWKAIWSSLKDANLFELDWALRRHNEFLQQFTPQTFVGNHDVTRIASAVGADGALAAAAILLTVGGIPSIYAGDEQGMLGVKENREGGDDAIRPTFPPSPAQLAENDSQIHRAHQALINIRNQNPWLAKATTETKQLASQNLVYLSASKDGKNVLEVEIAHEGKWAVTIKNPITDQMLYQQAA